MFIVCYVVLCFIVHSKQYLKYNENCFPKSSSKFKSIHFLHLCFKCVQYNKRIISHILTKYSSGT